MYTEILNIKHNNMRKTLILAAAAAMLLSSCVKEENAVTNERKVSFVIDGPVTRVTTTDNVTSFEVDDKIAITSNGLLSDITAAEYTVKADALEGQEVAYDGEVEATFVAHYPTSATYAEGEISFTVPAAQNADNFHNSMFMVAEATGSSTSPTVNLQFKHKLAWVKVILNGLDATQVSLENVLPTATWSKLALNASGTAAEVVAWKQNDEKTFWALVPAQTIEAGKRFISIATADKDYEYVLAENLTLTTAKVKTVTLSVDASGAVLATFSVDNMNEATWEDETTGLTGNVTETVIPAKEIISADAGDFSLISELNTTVTGWASATTPGWALVVNGTGSAVFNTELGEVQLTRANSDWYRIALVYYTGPNVKAGTYSLVINTRNLDATEDATSDDIQLKIYGTVGNAQIGSTQTIATKSEVTSAKRDITLANDYPEGISFVFYPKSNDGFTYAIQNVTVIEKK